MPNIIPAPMLEHFFTDDNGNPLSGGKLYAFKAGTNEPKDTYLDNETEFTNTHPIILDDAGSCRLFIQTNNDETGQTTDAYKFVLYDKDDNLIWTVDNVFSIIGQKGTPGGPVGPQGEKGDTGEQGVQGLKGLTGPKGDRGPTGDKGSFIIMWKNAGTFTWTIPENVFEINYELSSGGQSATTNVDGGEAISGRAGSIVTGTLTVSPNSTVNITIGGSDQNSEISSLDFPTVTALAPTDTNGFQRSFKVFTTTTIDGVTMQIIPDALFGESSPFGDGGNFYKYATTNATGNGAGGGTSIPILSPSTSSGVSFEEVGQGSPGILIITYSETASII